MTSDKQPWPDLAGRIVDDETGRRHVLPVRVYFEDTDAGGIAYHASFIRWCERGRTDFLRLLGTDSRRMIDGSASHEPAAFVVRRMLCDFIRPARMDDVLEVETRVKEMGGASVTLLQAVTLRGPARVRSRGHGRARRGFGQAAPVLDRPMRALSMQLSRARLRHAS